MEIFRSNDERAGMKRALAWLLAPLLLFVPILWTDPLTLWGRVDPLFYENILAMTTTALKNGHVLVRWFGEASAGFGSPVMLFYAPLGYLLTAFFSLWLEPLNLALGTQLFIGMYVSQVLSGYTAYTWLKADFSKRIAFIGSLFFVLLPYKFVYVYGHINLAQLWAVAFLPLWMLAAQQMARGGGNRPAGLYALAFAACYYAHPITVMAFAPIPVIYVLWFGRGRDWRDIYTRLLLANLLGFGICMMKLLPQYRYLDWIHPDAFLEGKSHWATTLFHIEVVLCAYYGFIAVIGCEMWRNKALKAQLQPRVGMLWVLVMCVSLFLTQRVSAFIWDNVPPLQYLQYPSARLHAGVLTGMVYLLCCWLTYYPVLQARARFLYHKVTMAVVISGFTIATLACLQEALAPRADITPAFIADVHEGYILPPPEYVTQWGCISENDAYGVYRHHAAEDPVAVLSGKVEMTLLQWQPPYHISLHAKVSSGAAEIVFRQCYFPLWRATEGTWKVDLHAEPATGLLAINLPPGVHDIEVSMPLTPMERNSRWVSLACLLAAVCFVWPRKAREEKPA